MKVLVLGFGPFLDIEENPASALALAVHGRGRRVRIVGDTMPVSYERSVAHTLQALAEHRPDALLGVGVAAKRTAASCEIYGHLGCSETPDVDGRCGPLAGPERLAATLDLNDALGLVRSEDAGRYVCNGWLHSMLQRTELPTGFLHIPPAGFPPDALVAALDGLASGTVALPREER